MLKNTILFFFFTIIAANKLFAQAEAIVNEGELGVSAGVAHYFGDINPNIGLKKPDKSFGLFFRKQYGNYISIRLHGNYSHIGYSDYRNSNPELQRRNLSFESDITSLSLRGDFNFFKFKPGSRNYRFTPFVSIGAGAFWFNPYTYIPGEDTRIELQPLTTEGVGYGKIDLIVPVGFGIKYNITKNINIGAEFTHYYTNSDYLDDVSKTYISASTFSPGSKGLLLFDRSDPADPYGIPGKNRGTSYKRKDTYVTGEITVAISFSSYKCPTYYK